MKIIISLFIFAISLFANIGTIALLKGEATIKRGNTILNAKIGDDIYSKDQIDTYAKSKLQLIFNDDTIVTMGANTKYIIDSYDNKNDLHAKMTLKRGFLKTITGKIGKIAPSRFKLKTRSATIGIRGTGWKTFIGANIENTVCFKGEITITTVDETFEIPAGNMLLITDNVAKKFKADMKFFNNQMKKVEVKQKKKIKPKVFIAKKNMKKLYIKKMEIKQILATPKVKKIIPKLTNVVIENIPPRIELEEKQVDVVLDKIDMVDEIVEDKYVEKVAQVVQEYNKKEKLIPYVREEAFEIVPLVKQKTITDIPNPSTGP